jgi:hypothetical protein
MFTVFWWGNLTERDHLVDADIDERIILKRMLHKCDERACTGLIWLIKIDKCRTLVHTAMNLQIPQNSGNSLSRLGTVSFSRINLRHEAMHMKVKKLLRLLSFILATACARFINYADTR